MYKITEEIFKLLSEKNLKPKTELKYKTKFEFLIASILSARCTDKQVNKVTKELFQVANTPLEIISLGESKLALYLKSLGLYKVKTTYIIESSKIILNNFNGELPSEFDALVTLPGVGRKVANVILNTIFSSPVIAVDTHVFRVSRRIGIAHSNSHHKVEQELYKNIHAHHYEYVSNWLVLHGRYICQAKKPKCSQCPISHLCNFFKENDKELQ